MHALVVEDEEEIAAHIKRALENAQFAVTLAVNGKDAIDALNVSEYDIVLLDLVLPDMDGLDVCIELRKQGVSAPVLMLTSRGFVEDRVLGLDVGADDYLTKPFSFDELLARVRALLRRERTVHYTTLQVGDVTLDPKTYVVIRNGTTLSLSSREYRVLNFLMRHPNQICTKTMLEEHVWGDYDSANSNVIEVTVSRLRKKLSDAGGDEFISTRRGVGYIIEE